MSLSNVTITSLRRIFVRGFSVHDIAEPLISFDAATGAADVLACMEEQSLRVVGVRREGHVVGYVEREDLGDGACGDGLRPFEPDQVLIDSARLRDVVLGLREAPRLFVSLLGKVGGIVTRTDLQKPPVRMWLFGMITLIEMRFTRMIEERCPNESWREFVSRGRLAKAETLRDERVRRNQDVRLIDCLQLADKAQIIAKNQELRALTAFESRRAMEDAAKRVESLRNHLAHSQDIIAVDWDTIVELAEHLDGILLGPPGLREENAGE